MRALRRDTEIRRDVFAGSEYHAVECPYCAAASPKGVGPVVLMSVDREWRPGV